MQFNFSKQGNAKTMSLIGVLIFLVMASALAPTMFSGWNSSALGPNAPTWLPTVMPIVIAGLLVTWAYKSYGKR